MSASSTQASYKDVSFVWIEELEQYDGNKGYFFTARTPSVEVE